MFRFVLGLGMGGEWNTGATLVAETWPDRTDEPRRSLSAELVGDWICLAALVAGVVLRYADWRAVFFVGILPAVVTLWIQNRVPESEMWRKSSNAGPQVLNWLHLRGSIAITIPSFIFSPALSENTLLSCFSIFSECLPGGDCSHGFHRILSLPVDQGGRGFGVMADHPLLVVLNLCGMFPGYASFGWVADHLGRRSFSSFTRCGSAA